MKISRYNLVLGTFQQAEGIPGDPSVGHVSPEMGSKTGAVGQDEGG